MGESERSGVAKRCYRCGAWMDEGDICPECGFDLNSPAEIRILPNPWRGGKLRVVNIDTGEVLFDGDAREGAELVRVEAPVRTRVRIECSPIVGWIVDDDGLYILNVRNGEAYRMEPNIRIPPRTSTHFASMPFLSKKAFKFVPI